MKNFEQLFIVLLLVTAGCGTPDHKADNNSANQAKASLKAKNDENKAFKRFTFLLTSNKPETEELLKGIPWKQIGDTSKNFGIKNVIAYKKDSCYFLVFETNTELNSEEVLTRFEDHIEVKERLAKLKKLGVTFPMANEALERIYKLDQKAIYSPNEGQLEEEVGPHKRFVWTLQLKTDPKLIAEYKLAHSMGKAWPQISKNMKEMGVKNMEIYLKGSQAMLIMDTEPNFDMVIAGPKWQKLPREKEWQNHVSKYQRIKPGSSIQEKWEDMNQL